MNASRRDRPRAPTRLLLPSAAEAVIERAARLTWAEVVRLDMLERDRRDVLLLAWDHLRDRLSSPPVRGLRFVARGRSWEAVGRSLTELGIEPTPDDGYWRVTDRVGAGSTRLARYAACALVAPDVLEPYFAATLITPWWSVVGDG